MISAEQLVKTLYPISQAGSRATMATLCKHAKRLPQGVPSQLDECLQYAGKRRWLALWWDAFDEDWVYADGDTEEHILDSEAFPRMLKEGVLRQALQGHRNVALVYDRIKRDGFVLAQGDATEFLKNRVKGQLDKVAQVLMQLRNPTNVAAQQNEKGASHKCADTENHSSTTAETPLPCPA